MDWQDREVLVTGAGGFIGSHLAERLAAEGARVRAFVHYNALGRQGWLEGSSFRDRMEIVAGDVCDADSVRDAMPGRDTVFHLAALIGIPYSYEAPRSYVRTNVSGTLNVLQAAREAGVRRVVHTSTSEVYGNARTAPMDETHPLQAQSPYAASKIGADKMAEAFACSFDLPVTIVRPFNTFGPRQSARAVIPTIIAQCLSGRGTIRLGNLDARRDMNYVDNTVDAFLLAAGSDRAIGQTIHFGSGCDVSIGDLAARIIGLTGADAVVEGEDKRRRPEASEIDRLLADSTRARDVLGWLPGVDLETGLRRTIEWMRGRLDLYRPDDYAV